MNSMNNVHEISIEYKEPLRGEACIAIKQYVLYIKLVLGSVHTQV